MKLLVWVFIATFFVAFAHGQNNQDGEQMKLDGNGTTKGSEGQINVKPVNPDETQSKNIPTKTRRPAGRASSGGIRRSLNPDGKPVKIAKWIILPLF